RRHTRSDRDWSSDVCSSDLFELVALAFWIFSSKWPSMNGPFLIERPMGQNLRFMIYDLVPVSRFTHQRPSHILHQPSIPLHHDRSEERRVGKECLLECLSCC